MLLSQSLPVPTFDVALATELLTTTRRQVADVARELGITTNQLWEWKRFSGITARAKLFGNNRAPGLSPKTAQNRYIEKRLGADDRERKLYGTLLTDVKFLRTRGFVIFKERAFFRVDNRLLNAQQLAELAARERRLLT